MERISLSGIPSGTSAEIPSKSSPSSAARRRLAAMERRYEGSSVPIVSPEPAAASRSTATDAGPLVARRTRLRAAFLDHDSRRA